MLKQINLNKVRWISKNFFNLWKVNYIYWRNGAGKSTVISSIIDSFKWKSWIKDGDISIFLDDTTEMSIKKWVVKWSVWLWKEMDLQVAWFFMNKETSWVNKTKDEKRQTIFNVLWIDREQFFKDSWVDFDIKWIRKEIKELEIKSKTLTWELLDVQSKLNSLEEIKKPKEVKLKEWNEEQYNLELYNFQEKELEVKKLNWELQYIELNKPEKIELIKTEIIEGNENEYQSLSNKIQEIKDKGKEIWDKLKSLQEWVCPCCKQTYSNPEEIDSLSKQLEELRIKYSEYAKEYNEFNLIKREVKEGNEKEYSEYLVELERYNNSLIRKEQIKEELTIKAFKLWELKTKVDSMKLVKSNRDKYDQYLVELKSYNEYLSNKKFLEDNIEDLKNKIRENSSIDLQTKLALYKKTEKEFIAMLEWKARLDEDTKFIFFRELKTPNTDGDFYTSDFDIEYKGKLYSECSMWEKAYIDILLAKMFIDYNAVLDFIVIDNAELSDENLDKIIKEQLTWYQVFATRITDGDLDIVSK